jgi:hypothetical protein
MKISQRKLKLMRIKDEIKLHCKTKQKFNVDRHYITYI